MAISKDDILEAVGAMSVMDLNDLVKAFEEKFGVRVQANYGLTENTASAAIAPRSGEPRYGASGIRIPYTQIKTVVLDQNGAYLRHGAQGEPGVIAVKGPGVISGYVDEKLNRGLFFPDGWLNTGDLGRIDEDGYLWITGRVKDLIIRGGNNIDPSIIDDTLLQHPAVQLAAAVGKPDALTTAAHLPRRQGRLYVFGVPHHENQEFPWFHTVANETEIITSMGPECMEYFQNAGGVQTAKVQSLQHGTILSIGFHSPSRRLFRKYSCSVISRGV